MKKFLAFSLVVTVFFGIAHIANAATIGFDDLSGNVAVTDQYAPLGIIFQQTVELDTWNEAYAPVKHPGDHIAYSGSFSQSIFIFDDVISSFSLLVTSGNNTLYLEAYDNSDNLLGFASEYIPIGDWHSMDIELTGFPAQKIILHDGSGYFAFDEITFSHADTPEPCTFLLLVAGLLGFAGIRRKIRISA
ncbi:MAG: PEP-CTERM sorting domain-containing protein [bacterium]